MLNLVLPIGSGFGWGTFGRYVTRELARQTQVRLITTPWEADLLPMEQEFLESVATLVPAGTCNKLAVEGSVLQVVSPNFNCTIADVTGSSRTACIFFESDSFASQALERARSFDRIAVGSTWCDGILRAAGLTNSFVATQGVDPRLFNPEHSQKEFATDKFTVFSGGKFEFRKGQDLVIRAFKVLQDRHKDVQLITAWYNPWPGSMQSMSASSHLQLPTVTGTYHNVIAQIISANGIDPLRSVVLGPVSPALLPQIYKNTDVGLFPNRCEGGTNLVLMEYMACGKPVIAAFNTGQTDVLADGHAILLRKMKPLRGIVDGQSTPLFEADLDETVEQLEWAYHNRDRLAEIGNAAGEEMKKFPWSGTVEVLRQNL